MVGAARDALTEPGGSGGVSPETTPGARVSSPRERTNRFAVAAAVLAAATILSIQLFVPPVIGLADNGDFDRVMRSVGLEYASSARAERYVNWALTKFRRVAPDPGSRAYASSEAPLAAVAVAFADRFGATRTFDMRFLAAVHVVLLLLAIGLLVASTRELAPWVQWLAAAMLVLLFTDVGYAAPLNSMYTQVAGFLFFMVKTGIAAVAIRRGGTSRGQLFAYFILAALFVMSKPQESIHGLLLALLGLSLGRATLRGFWRQPAVWLAAALCALSLWYYRGTPSWLRELALYNTLFRELIPQSPDAGRDLAELGLDPDLARYSGRSPYPPDSPFHEPAFRAQVFPQYGYGAMLRFYLRHPARLAKLILRGTESAFQLRPVGLANYAQDSGRAPRTQTDRFAWWSRARGRLEKGAPLWLALLLGGNLVAAAAGYRSATDREKMFRRSVAILAALAAVEFLVAVLADILGDLARHLFVFHAMVDVLIVVDVGWIAVTLSRRWAIARGRAAASWSAVRR